MIIHHNKNKKVICPNCRKGLIITEYYTKCACGVLPKKIIENFPFAEKIKMVLPNKDVDINEQQFLWQIVKEGQRVQASTLERTKEILQENTLFYSSYKNLKEVLANKHIHIKGNFPIFPLYDEHLICKFIICEKPQRVIKFLNGGSTFNFTLTKQLEDTNKLFVFQNALFAAKTIIRNVKSTGKYPPIIAVDIHDCVNSLLKYSEKDIVLVIEKDLDPLLLRELLIFSPRVIFMEEFNQIAPESETLLLAAASAFSLQKYIPKIFPLTKRKALLIRDDAWYLLPTKRKVLNCNVKIEEVIKSQRKVAFSGKIFINNKEIPFLLPRKNFFKHLQNKCLQNKCILIVGEKRIRKKFEQILFEINHDIIYKKRFLGFSPKKEKIVLPKVTIYVKKENKRIIVVNKENFISGKNIPGSNIIFTKRSKDSGLYPIRAAKTRITITQLIITLAVCLFIMETGKRPSFPNRLIFICRNSVPLLFMLNKLGILLYEKISKI